METYGSNTIKYFYGSSGIAGFSYNGIDCYYRKNLQGDIIAIHGIDGTRLVSYRYDAWGNILEVYDASGIGLGAINPFRYRGYYYDTETGLYYLNSRYYDPETGRFINADSLEYLGVNGDFVNYNLFVYCGNNPVMNKDPEGEFFLTAIIIGTIAGVAIGFGATAYADYADDGEVFNGSVEAKDYIINTLVAGTIGAGVGMVAPYVPGFLASQFTMHIPTGLVSAVAGTEAVVETVAITVTGAQVLDGLCAILGIMFSLIRKSGGYRFEHHYPNDHDPTHVHIKGDDGKTRVDLDGNPLKGDRPMTPGERKAFERIYELIKKALSPWT